MLGAQNPSIGIRFREHEERFNAVVTIKDLAAAQSAPKSLLISYLIATAPLDWLSTSGLVKF